MKVALIDDSTLVRRNLRAALQKLGHEPTEVEPRSVFEVLKVLRKTRPDLAILDLMMPRCPGLSVVRFVREDPELSRLPILILSAHIDATSGDLLAQLGVQGVLGKPFTMEDLETRLAGAAEGKRWAPAGPAYVVALVDDHQGRRQILSRVLEAGKFRLRDVEVDSPYGVLDALLQGPPHLILLGEDISRCSLASLLRGIREDPVLGAIPVMLYGQRNEADAVALLEPFGICGYFDLRTPSAQLSERFVGEVHQALAQASARPRPGGPGAAPEPVGTPAAGTPAAGTPAESPDSGKG